jgi:hypothetical protein
MKRPISMVLLAIPLILGATAAFAADGEYYYRDLKGKGHRSEARVQADTVSCIARAGYTGVRNVRQDISRDPAYVGCMRARGWVLAYVMPPVHRSHAGRNHGTPYTPTDNGPDNSGQSMTDQMSAAAAQNAAAQAQNDAANAATQLFMNQMNQITPGQ